MCYDDAFYKFIFYLLTYLLVWLIFVPAFHVLLVPKVPPSAFSMLETPPHRETGLVPKLFLNVLS